jgi:hypothetical protein
MVTRGGENSLLAALVEAAEHPDCTPEALGTLVDLFLLVLRAGREGQPMNTTP